MKDKGQALVEYAFMLALVVIVVIIIISLFGTTLAGYYQDFVDMFS